MGSDQTEQQGQPTIAVVGLGPGDFSLLTIGALERLQLAHRIFFRTLVHPTVEPVRRRLQPDQLVESFDDRYERASSFSLLYKEIADALIKAAVSAQGPIAYAVPGHPLVGEQSVNWLLQEAPRSGVIIEIVEGISFLEPLLTALGLDPLDQALQIMDGAALLALEQQHSEGPDPQPWQGLSPRMLATDRPLILGQIYDRRVASACKLWLLERYPPEHTVKVITAVGTQTGRVRDVSLAELDHSAAFDHLTSLFVPPLDRLKDLRALSTLPYIAARLRAPDGCPWDREQTWQSLKPHLLEEAFEAVSALDSEDPDEIAEELGDVLLLVTMLAGIGEEQGSVDLPQVMEAINSKLIRRHPHVFGSGEAASSQEVTQNWERIKATEHQEPRSVLDGVPTAMPALIAAQVMQRKAAAIGFDWKEVSAVLAKVDEELEEVRQASTAEQRTEEVGDLLFTMVSVCRHLDIDAEEALRRANAKFRNRLQAVEQHALQQGSVLATLDEAALDELWRMAKAQPQK